MLRNGEYLEVSQSNSCQHLLRCQVEDALSTVLLFLKLLCVAWVTSVKLQRLSIFVKLDRGRRQELTRAAVEGSRCTGQALCNWRRCCHAWLVLPRDTSAINSAGASTWGFVDMYITDLSVKQAEVIYIKS